MDNGAGQNHLDRREKPRISQPFPIKVLGVGTRGKAFNVDTIVINLSTGGVYLQLPRFVRPGTKLFVLIRMTTTQSEKAPGPQVAAHGRVLRAEPRPEGLCGLAIAFTSYRFL
jgi:PilZ domain-containing protein